MKDEDFIKEVKKKSEDIIIPESLEPDKVREKLINHKRMKKRRLNIIISAAAICLFVVATVGIVFNENNNKNENKVIVKSEVVSGIKNFKSYDELYESLDNIEYLYENEDLLLNENSNTETTKDTFKKGYSETNTQVDGIDEGDIVKTDGEYIYLSSFYYSSIVRIVKANNGEMELYSEIDLSSLQLSGDYEYTVEDMYIYKDNMIIYTNGKDYNSTEIFIFDISDRKSPKHIKTLSQDGYYSSSRLVGDKLYTFSNYEIYGSSNVKSDEECIPKINDKPIKCGLIYTPEEVTNKSYVIMTSINLKDNNDFYDKKAVLASGNIFYMSNENIYVADNNTTQNTNELLKFSYKDGNIEPVARVKIPGSLNNQFSMDEKDGYLRLVTTVYESKDNTYLNEETYKIAPLSDNSSNSLYILDEKLNIVGSIENLAKGEIIYSARFIGDTAYFVTFKQIDPLFSVDVSDPKNPKVLGELKIPGLSDYLHLYKENLLLGIGEEIDANTGEFKGIKLSMFDISDPSNVKEVHKLVLSNFNKTEALYNHKAVLIDSSKNIIGFYANEENYEDGSCNNNYLVFSYDNEKGFISDFSKALECEYTDQVRGIYIDKVLYVINVTKEIISYNLENYDEISHLKFN